MTARKIEERADLFLAKRRPNSWSDDEINVGTVRTALKLALAALEDFGDDDSTVVIAAADRLVRARYELDEIDRYLPRLEAWCVVKHYSHHRRGDTAWTPATWVGCTTREQAIEFCDVLAEHYGKQADAHGWDRDTWTVERRPIRIENVVAPDVTAAQYKEFVLR